LHSRLKKSVSADVIFSSDAFCRISVQRASRSSCVAARVGAAGAAATGVVRAFVDAACGAGVAGERAEAVVVAALVVAVLVGVLVVAAAFVAAGVAGATVGAGTGGIACARTRGVEVVGEGTATRAAGRVANCTTSAAMPIRAHVPAITL
jgi:hypothetical protein